eukprot:3436136-Prorocentrum_lima.AAC.1
MTSSLVGSEMCIRDRLQSALQRLCNIGKNVGQYGIDCWWSWRVQSSRTVSYTHLTLPTICSV